jgi:hypothetical protein
MVAGCSRRDLARKYGALSKGVSKATQSTCQYSPVERSGFSLTMTILADLRNGIRQ